MKADTTETIRDRIVTARSRLLASVAGLTSESWGWEPGGGRWSIAETLAHVGAAQWSHLDAARRFLDGEQTGIQGFDLNAWNRAAVAEREGWTVQQILQDLDAAGQETLEFLATLGPDDMRTTGFHPALGTVSVAQVLRVIAIHDGMHRKDILALLEEMSKS